jgi:hypothetical protein
MYQQHIIVLVGSLFYIQVYSFKEVEEFLISKDLLWTEINYRPNASSLIWKYYFLLSQGLFMLFTFSFDD